MQKRLCTRFVHVPFDCISLSRLQIFSWVLEYLKKPVRCVQESRNRNSFHFKLSSSMNERGLLEHSIRQKVISLITDAWFILLRSILIFKSSPASEHLLSTFCDLQRWVVRKFILYLFTLLLMKSCPLCYLHRERTGLQNVRADDFHSFQQQFP